MDDMREKVMHGLECIAKKVTFAQYRNTEPRIMTLEELQEIKEGQFLWIEGIKDGRFYCLEIIGVHYSLDGVTDIDFNTPTAFIELSTEKIGKTWRPWTKQPTEEQRETAKRNGG